MPRRRPVAPQREQVAQLLRNRRWRGMVAPVRGVLSPGQRVMQLQEVDHAFPAVAEGVVEAPRDDVHGRTRRGHLLAEHGGRELDQGQGRGLQRLDETGRQADRHAVAVPELLAVAGPEGQLSRRDVLGPAGALDVGSQRLFCRGVRGVRARVDMTDTPARGQADVPHPATGLRRGQGLRRDGAVLSSVGDLHGQRGVVEQHVLLRHPRDPEVLGQQQRGQASAIDEEVTRHGAMGLRLQRCDVTVVVAVDADDMVQHMRDTETLDAMSSQEQAELACIEVVAVVGHGGKLGRGGLLGRLALCAQVRLEAHQVGKRHIGVMRQPRGHQIGLAVALGQHEGVGVVVGGAAVNPALEPGALFERGITFAEQLGLGHADLAQGVAHRRPGAFADADRADVRRLQQRHPQSGVGAGAVLGSQDGCGQPSGRPAADDDHLSDRLAHFCIHFCIHRSGLPAIAGKVNRARASKRKSR